MTNKPTIDGVSLKLIQDAVNGNRQESREAIRELREFLRNQLDAPAVERQEPDPDCEWCGGCGHDHYGDPCTGCAQSGVASLQSTIARLEARIAELESGRGELVAVMYADGSVLTKAECGTAFEICCKVETPLFTAPPAPVAVVLPERKSDYGRERDSHYVAEVEGWNACLDATAALNGPKS